VKLILLNDAGDELFDWNGDPIRFDASVKSTDKVRLCFEVHTPDPKAMAKATSAARKGARA